MQQLDRAHLVIEAAALASDLHHASVLARGGDHLDAFEDVVRRGLLDVDVLAGFASPDGGQRVPMIRQRHRHRVDVVVREGIAHVAVAFRRFTGLAIHARLRAFQSSLIDVAKRGDACVADLQVVGEMILPAAPEANDRDIHLVVRAHHLPGGERRRRAQVVAGLHTFSGTT